MSIAAAILHAYSIYSIKNSLKSLMQAINSVGSNKDALVSGGCQLWVLSTFVLMLCLILMKSGVFLRHVKTSMDYLVAMYLPPQGFSSDLSNHVVNHVILLSLNLGHPPTYSTNLCRTVSWQVYCNFFRHVALIH